MEPENFDGKGNFDIVLCHQYFVNTIYLKFSTLILFIISHSPYFKNGGQNGRTLLVTTTVITFHMMIQIT